MPQQLFTSIVIILTEERVDRFGTSQHFEYLIHLKHQKLSWKGKSDMLVEIILLNYINIKIFFLILLFTNFNVLALSHNWQYCLNVVICTSITRNNCLSDSQYTFKVLSLRTPEVGNTATESLRSILCMNCVLGNPGAKLRYLIFKI